MHRRQFLGSLAAAACLPRGSHANVAKDRLRAGVHRQQILPADYPDTELWSFDAAFPGRVLRARAAAASSALRRRT